MLPQLIIDSDDLEMELFDICKNKKNNHITKYKFEQKLHKLTEANDFRVVFNAYYGLAYLATIYDNDKLSMIKYMNILESLYPDIARVYNCYGFFAYLFEDYSLLKENILKCLELPINTEHDFFFLADNALSLKDPAVYSLILDKCEKFSNHESYKQIQMNTGDFDFSSFEDKANYSSVNLKELFA